MGVQARVPGPGVVVVEPRRDHPGGPDLPAPGGPDAGPDHGVLDEPQRLSDRGVVGADDRGAGALVTQGPEHGGGLRDGERQVEPDHRPHPPTDVGRAERGTGDGVVAVAEHRRHPRLRDHVPHPNPGAVLAEAGQAVAEPAARRGPGRLVVGDQRLTGGEGRVAGGDLPGQVGIPVPGEQLVHPHHRQPPPPRHPRTEGPLPEGVRENDQHEGVAGREPPAPHWYGCRNQTEDARQRRITPHLTGVRHEAEDRRPDTSVRSWGASGWSGRRVRQGAHASGWRLP